MDLPLSAAVCAGDLVFLSGIPPVEDGRTVAPGDLAAQTACVLRRAGEILGECGLSLNDLVFVHVYLRDMADFGRFNAAYAELMPSPYPARKVIITELPCAEAGIEISGIASRHPARHYIGAEGADER